MPFEQPQQLEQNIGKVDAKDALTGFVQDMNKPDTKLSKESTKSTGSDTASSILPDLQIDGIDMQSKSEGAADRDGDGASGVEDMDKGSVDSHGQKEGGAESDGDGASSPEVDPENGKQFKEDADEGSKDLDSKMEEPQDKSDDGDSATSDDDSVDWDSKEETENSDVRSSQSTEENPFFDRSGSGRGTESEN